MSLAQVLPEIQSLSRQDKIRLIQIIAQDLEQDAIFAIENGATYPVLSPDREFAAAAVLLRVLEEEGDQQ